MKHSQSLSHLSFLQLLLALFFILSLTGCPDPEGQYEAFNTRRDDTLAARAENMENEMMGGEMMGGEMMGGEMMAGEMEELGPIPQITSGSFLFGLAPNLNVDKPMTFVADVEIEVNEDGSAGQVISMTLDPRTCEDLNASAGDPVLFTPEEATPITEGGYFSADFGLQMVAGTANCISGSLIEAEIQLDGRVFNESSLCGEMNGMLYRPYPADLGYSEITMERSTFAAIKLEGGEDINTLEIPKNCDDITALFASEE